MKNKLLFICFILAGISAEVTFDSCSSNQKGNEQTAKDTSTITGGNLMQEGPAYDATKIDPNAPVMVIALKTTGNSMSEMKYDQKELHVKAGSTIKLTLINQAKDSSMQHNFILIEKGTADNVAAEGLKAGLDNNYTPKMKDVLVSLHLVGPGMKAEITFPAPAKGSYDFICSYPGHYKTMNGVFIVE